MRDLATGASPLERFPTPSTEGGRSRRQQAPESAAGRREAAGELIRTTRLRVERRPAS